MAQDVQPGEGRRHPRERAALACRRASRAALRVGLALLIAASLPHCASAPKPLVLVTDEEAALEPLPRVRSRADLEDGPLIELESPDQDGVYRGPFPIRVRIEIGPKGYSVDRDSLRVYYVKLWDIDITSRIEEFIDEYGISAPAVELPTGRHTVRLYIEDVEDNATSRSFSVRVEAPD